MTDSESDGIAAFHTVALMAATLRAGAVLMRPLADPDRPRVRPLRSGTPVGGVGRMIPHTPRGTV